MEMRLPDIEEVAAKVHEAWMETKRAHGVTSRKSEDGEELMSPYEQLSEQAKELDRSTVRAVYAAIRAIKAED
ncbi:MAG TPA: RyR domain-containing protein [Pyrinomonadaceae bacterium]|nr:RyR domain-containing protein [Pyrinomonadaceae bacterium]